MSCSLLCHASLSFKDYWTHLTDKTWFQYFFNFFLQLLESTPTFSPSPVYHWMDWSLKLKCCAFAIASVTLGLSAVYVQQRATSSRKRRKSTCNSFISMAAAAEIDCPSNNVSQLVSTMEQLKVAQQPAESPLPPSDDVEILDRDSANHSPSDFLIGNLHSDSHSEVFVIYI